MYRVNCSTVHFDAVSLASTVIPDPTDAIDHFVQFDLKACKS
jgi:hypothetical protein